ncbi:ribose-5-phosphate isomerase RpiA [Microvirga sp. SRT01]|uniref:Ribose 5-phosphate isomerase A n=1 Tax=Sphingomonas longa TaxID=2778730 RepID=A0ABS2D5T4_9SPHN|nr:MULTISPECIES: ribose-5-phosphate isomerase RpiA [Alphaproteobacteria]MBM6576279.1 ribose-5-phosphate isomerase RpiA [Sphingomonas sp. BT552]MBR7709325.1 ribose-5-phosphate isomerase RpiA [Microvirga sp. SRT01]
MHHDSADIDTDKRLAAEAAVQEVASGMLVGLGTGSTAAHAIRAIGRLGLDIDAVATSNASADLARSVGIRVRDFADVARVDLTIDGADEIDADFRAIKGAGGAMLREKVVACASRRMIVIADASKRVATIGAAKLPVEVLPFAAAYVADRITGLVRSATWRGEYLTDNGNRVLDCVAGAYHDWEALADAIACIPGVVGHGLFLKQVDAAYIADRGVVTRTERAGLERAAASR